jgi:hypothetical protein
MPMQFAHPARLERNQGCSHLGEGGVARIDVAEPAFRNLRRESASKMASYCFPFIIFSGRVAGTS